MKTYDYQGLAPLLDYSEQPVRISSIGAEERKPMNQYRKTQKQREVETVAAKERRKKEQIKALERRKKQLHSDQQQSQELDR